jgi:cytochrome P450
MTERTKTESKKLPPIAKGSIPIANHAFKFKGDMHHFLEENCKTMGPIFSFKLFSKTYYVLNHPDFIKHVLVDNVKNYSRKKSYAILAELLGQGLITTEGEKWRKRRRMAQPAFYKEKLEVLLQQMEESIHKFVANWEGEKTKHVDIDKELSHITLDVLSNSIIQSDLQEKYPIVKKNLSEAWTYLSQKRFKFIKLMNKLPSKTKSDGQASISSLKKIILEVIENRRKSNIEYFDLLSMLMASTDEETSQQLTNEELLDEVITLFTAGHDTTAVVLTWAFYLIGQHLEVQEKILQEINEKSTDQPLGMKELMGFQYTKMVIQETMRLYPPVWTFGRKAVQDDEIGGYFVPAGTSVTLPALFVQRNPEFWEKPNDFYPEHFLPEKMKAQKKFSYFPFGGGQHLCIGEHYAMMEMQLVIIHLLKKYKLTLATEKPVGVNLLITIRPKEIIWANFEKRK